MYALPHNVSGRIAFLNIKAIAASVLLITGLPLSGAFSQTAKKIDILGITLDGGIDDALAAIKLINGADVQQVQGTLKLGQFTTPTLKFGAVVHFKDKFTDYIRIAYDLQQPQSVMAMRWAQLFASGQMPTTGAMKQALVEKYGVPVFESGPERNWHAMIWHSGPPVNFKASAGFAKTRMEYNPCTKSLGFAVGGNINDAGLWTGRYDAIRFNTLGNCGIWIVAEFYPSKNNESLVGNMTLTIGDVARMKASQDYVDKLMKDGVSAMQNQEKIRAGAIKPRL